MRESRKHAVVCGASMAGLLAARVLSDFYQSVTVVERDELPTTASQRRGVSQGRHLHMLLTRGLINLIELFPGLLDELAGAGALVLDGTDPSLFYLRAGNSEMSVSGSFTRPEELRILLASRPLLEGHVRRRLRAIENVSVIDGHDAIGPTIDSGRITGVSIVDRKTGQERRLDSDLLVDATGRGGRIPAFLQTHGYPRPPEQTYSVQLSYSSQFFQIPPGALDQKVVVVNQPLDKAAGVGLLAYEDDTAILTLIGLAGYRPPTDLPGVLDAASKLLPSQVISALRCAEPLGEVAAQLYPASVWRRYDKLRRFPDGLLVLGDAVCSLNPVWGQGMTSAALQAAALHQCLRLDEDDLRQRFFRATTKQIAPIWRGNRLLDFGVTPADDWQRTPKRLLNGCISKIWSAAETDIALTETFMRSIELLDPLTTWISPPTLKRIVASHRGDNHRPSAAGPATSR